MTSLKKEYLDINFENIRLLQNIEPTKSVLKHIGLKVIEINERSLFREFLDGLEACITVISGKANVKINIII